MRKNNAQAAMEFLMTYGWALMAAMIVLGLLYQYGGLNPSNLRPDSCEFDLGVDCLDFRLASNGEDKALLKISNGFSKPIILYRISFEDQLGLIEDCVFDLSRETQNCTLVDTLPKYCADTNSLTVDTPYAGDPNNIGFYLAPTQEASIEIPCENINFDGKMDIPIILTYYYADANYSYSYEIKGSIYGGIS